MVLSRASNENRREVLKGNSYKGSLASLRHLHSQVVDVHLQRRITGCQLVDIGLNSIYLSKQRFKESIYLKSEMER